MNIGKYISELLFFHERVMLPGFGTFSKKYMPARFIPEKKVIEPPAKIVDFRNEPKIGDTPLVGYIAEKESLDTQAVTAAIKAFVKNLEHEMEAGKAVTLENIGVFSRETDGSLKFEPSLHINYLAEGTGQKAVKTPEQSNVEEPVKATPEPQKTKDKQTTPDSTHPKKQEAMKEPVKKASEEKNTLPPALKWVVYVIIPLLVVLIVFFFSFNFFFGEEGLFRKTEEVAKKEVIVEEVAEPVIEEVAEVIEEPEIIEPVKEVFDPTVIPPGPEPGRRVYYIVVGSFENINNAQNLALNLRKEGFERANVLGVTPAGFHRTYAGFYYDLREAEAQKELLKEDLREIAWILHR